MTLHYMLHFFAYVFNCIESYVQLLSDFEICWDYGYSLVLRLTAILRILPASVLCHFSDTLRDSMQTLMILWDTFDISFIDNPIS